MSLFDQINFDFKSILYEEQFFDGNGILQMNSMMKSSKCNRWTLFDLYPQTITIILVILYSLLTDWSRRDEPYQSKLNWLFMNITIYSIEIHRKYSSFSISACILSSSDNSSGLLVCVYTRVNIHNFYKNSGKKHLFNLNYRYALSLVTRLNWLWIRDFIQ